MTQKEATQLVQAEFLSAWGTTTLIAWDDLFFDADKVDVPWVRLQIIHDGSDVATFGGPGNSTYRSAADIWLRVYTLTDKGRAANDDLVEQAILIFRGQEFVLGQESIWFQTVGGRTIGGEGKWFQQQMFARAFFDTIQ